KPFASTASVRDSPGYSSSEYIAKSAGVGTNVRSPQPAKRVRNVPLNVPDADVPWHGPRWIEAVCVAVKTPSPLPGSFAGTWTTIVGRTPTRGLNFVSVMT